MSDGKRNKLNASLLALGLLSLVLVVAVSLLLSGEAGLLLTRNTIRLSLVCYAAALCMMMRLDNPGWSAESALGQVARWSWTWAWVVFMIHVAMAFHFHHHWSHADAFNRTREVSGAGEGIYVSYLFLLLWGLDVLFWWWRPQAYAARPPLVGRALHAFMLFIVFNGMVVFESGFIRWAGVAMFLLLPIVWWTSMFTSASRPSQTA